MSRRPCCRDDCAATLHLHALVSLRAGAMEDAEAPSVCVDPASASPTGGTGSGASFATGGLPVGTPGDALAAVVSKYGLIGAAVHVVDLDGVDVGYQAGLACLDPARWD